MKKRKLLWVCWDFSVYFEALMPMVGWICVHMIVEYFSALEKIYSVDGTLLVGIYPAGHSDL